MKRYFQMDTEITYLEILVIVAILAVILNVFVPGVLSVVENNRMSTYKKDLQIIKKHVIDYVKIVEIITTTLTLLCLEKVLLFQLKYMQCLKKLSGIFTMIKVV